MSLKFGTSGLRGLVTEMTDRECALYTAAFVRYLAGRTANRTVATGGDLRNSTPRVLRAVSYALAQHGLRFEYCGEIPTPALMAYAVERGQASVMVTGSHVPADRNGIKFSLRSGEVLKQDEAAITRLYTELREGRWCEQAFASDGSLRDMPVLPTANREPALSYVRRYLDFFPAGCLAGTHVVVYQHSAVGRDLLVEILTGLGASVVGVGRAEVFRAVDTEAVEDRDLLAQWVRSHRADALVSTDGDSDRPLVVDEQGSVVRGDVLGVVASRYLRADAVALPVSCSTALELWGGIASVTRTKIGSPYVVAAMTEAVAQGGARVVGYEANGGFLTSSDMALDDPDRVLKALPTRDAVLPILAVLHEARRLSVGVSGLLADLPQRFTWSGLLRGFPQDLGRAVVEAVQRDPVTFAATHLGALFGRLVDTDFTDGARMHFEPGHIVHLRPSGNAPEFRCYAEAASQQEAAEWVERTLSIVQEGILPELTESRGG